MLPKAVHPRIDRLKKLHSQRDELLARYQVERAALELKYTDLMKPLYEERRGVVNGELEDEKETGEGDGEAGGEGDGAAVGGDEEVKGIPQFWACAMGNMDVIAELITEGACIILLKCIHIDHFRHLLSKINFLLHITCAHHNNKHSFLQRTLTVWNS